VVQIAVDLHACTPCRVQAGVHAVFRISKQISPVLKWTFGWKTLVVNLAFGGSKG
jgi:hypothetical protein